MTVDSPINVGLNYQFKPSERDTIDMSLGLVRGNTVYANIAVHSNFNIKAKPKIIPPKEILNQPYLDSYDQLNTEWHKSWPDF